MYVCVPNTLQYVKCTCSNFRSTFIPRMRSEINGMRLVQINSFYGHMYIVCTCTCNCMYHTIRQYSTCIQRDFSCTPCSNFNIYMYDNGSTCTYIKFYMYMYICSCNVRTCTCICIYCGHSEGHISTTAFIIHTHA